VLINIWAKAKYKDGWILKIIGSGENYSNMVSQIKRMGLSRSVFIFDPTKDIESEYVSASFFVLTSRTEGFGLVLLEAMACGLPCVAFNCPSGPKDIISDGHSGFLIKAGDEEMFLNRLEAFLKDEALRKKFGSAARIDALKFEEQLICKKFNMLFRKHFKFN
jgi:glycosyltransferase involved in cell wall biosynthesis